MKTVMLKYGAAAGAAAIGPVLLAFSLGGGHGVSGPAEWLGYLFMILALSLIFLAVKRWRDRELGGVIRFGTAFMLGLGISLVAGVAYVAIWEAYLAATDHAFIERYAASVLESKREAGLDEGELQELSADLDRLVESYRNPLFRLPMTFLEIFPVGLLLSLVAALVLRKESVLPESAPAPSAADG